MSIGQKIIEVMQACRTMYKDSSNDTQGYKYLSASAMFAKINEEFTKRDLFTQCEMKLAKFQPVTTSDGREEKFAVVSATVIVTDADTGEQVKFVGTGSGQDAGDKAVMKANTAALKYAYIGGLCIAMSDDPEADTNTNAYAKRPNPAGMNNIEGKCYKCSAPITRAVIEYSTKNFGQPLCKKCQSEQRAADPF